MSRNAQHLAKVLLAFDRTGIAYRVVQGKHIKIVFQHNGREQHVSISRSPSDGNAHRQAIRDLNRILRGERFLQ